MFAREVDDHKLLWETEVKSRSKLGLRVSPKTLNQKLFSLAGPLQRKGREKLNCVSVQLNDVTG